MRRSSRSVAAAALLAVAATVACGTARREPGPAGVRPATGEGASAHPAAGAPASGTQRAYTAADVRFMGRMMAHHAQALTMTELVPARTTREDIRLLAERIDVSQRDEIAAMRQWLGTRGEEVPSPDAPDAHHGGTGHHALMPGMLTAEELSRLARATGAEFDRLFLGYMIRHHEGALAMVAELLATPGAAQEPELFRFVSDVDADQRAEIARMRRLQEAAPASVPPR